MLKTQKCNEYFFHLPKGSIKKLNIHIFLTLPLIEKFPEVKIFDLFSVM